MDLVQRWPWGLDGRDPVQEASLSDANEDLIQETWQRAARGLAAFRWQASLRTWLTGIALNLCHEHYRRGVRLEALPDPRADGSPDVSLNLASGAELRQAISTLPNRCREVLLLHDVEGHTHEEIGTLLGISQGTSKSQLHRARRRLQQVFAQEEQAHGWETVGAGASGVA